jgi:hypothetical protein
LAQRSSRKRRKQRQRERAAQPAPETGRPRGYAASREKDEAARRALKPLPKGERPMAVTVGATCAALLALANLVGLIGGYSGDSRATVWLIGGSLVMALVAGGMWKARYWAVLGMQTVLAFVIVGTALGIALGTYSALKLLGLIALLLASGVLFWFLVKAMARIRMPDRPGARS